MLRRCLKVWVKFVILQTLLLIVHSLVMSICLVLEFFFMILLVGDLCTKYFQYVQYTFLLAFWFNFYTLKEKCESQTKRNLESWYYISFQTINIFFLSWWYTNCYHNFLYKYNIQQNNTILINLSDIYGFYNSKIEKILDWCLSILYQ